MKIDNAVKNVTTPRTRETKSGKATGRAGQIGNPTVSDNVRLTDHSSQLQVLEAQLTDIEVSDPGKVDAIRQAIADGTFQVDEEAVAESLVQESLENLGRQANQP